MITEIAPLAAYELLGQDSEVLLVDVRSTVEYDYVGHPIDSVHLPLKDFPTWEIDPEFVTKLRVVVQAKGKTMPEDTPLLFICRSGARSMLAAELSHAAGFKKVYNITQGFEGDKDKNNHRNAINGWRFHGLPWEQS